MKSKFSETQYSYHSGSVVALVANQALRLDTTFPGIFWLWKDRTYYHKYQIHLLIKSCVFPLPNSTHLHPYPFTSKRNTKLKVTLHRLWGFHNVKQLRKCAHYLCTSYPKILSETWFGICISDKASLGNLRWDFLLLVTQLISLNVRRQGSLSWFVEDNF